MNRNNCWKTDEFIVHTNHMVNQNVNGFYGPVEKIKMEKRTITRKMTKLARKRWKKSAENLMKFVYDSWKSVNTLNKIMHILHINVCRNIQN